MKRHTAQQGAVSLFVVIFSALLITIVTISFLRIMVKDQQQASNADLSQSAYDSSMAGVEDAKRALLKYQSACNSGDTNECNRLKALLNSDECNVGVKTVSGVNGGTDEVLIQQSVSGTDSRLDQAYTCVKIELDTADYVGSIIANESALVPLKGTQNFNRVQVDWFSAKDVVTDGDLDIGSGSNGTPLLGQASWPTNRPSVLRTQLIQTGSTFNAASFDNTVGGQSNANTLFLYPVGYPVEPAPGNLPAPTGLDFAGDARRVPTGSPEQVSCVRQLTAGGYSCRAIISVPAPIGGNRTNAYLRLTPLYTGTHYRVSLFNNTTTVSFDGVQPEVDSTGRANDLFRRVKSRVNFLNEFVYPNAGVETSSEFCKDFSITNNVADYNPGTCLTTGNGATPNQAVGTGAVDFVTCSNATCTANTPAPTNPGNNNPRNTRPSLGVGWNVTFRNTSNNPVNQVARCTWDFDDGGARGDPEPIRSDNCFYGDIIRHNFYPNNYAPPYRCETYNVVLTVYLKDGSQIRKSMVKRLPYGPNSPC